MAKKGPTIEELPELEFKAWKKAVAAGLEKMSEQEIWNWLDSLPQDEAIAVLVDCAEIVEADKLEAQEKERD